jgi:lysozyme family protein
MADFDQAAEYVLGLEGGLSTDPNDPGGTTNFGIAQRWHPDIDVRTLTRDGAKQIYRSEYWRFDGVNSQRLANRLLSMSVNTSLARTVRFLQVSLKGILAGPVVQDGVFGERTLEFTNAADETRLIDELKARMAYSHCQDVIAKPAQLGELLGWLRRDVRD